MQLMGKKFIYPQEILQTIAVKYKYLKQHKNTHDKLSKVDSKLKLIMVAPIHSVVVNLDVGTSHHRNGGFCEEKIISMNTNYISGYVIDYTSIPFQNICFPTHIYNKFNFVKY